MAGGIFTRAQLMTAVVTIAVFAALMRIDKTRSIILGS